MAKPYQYPLDFSPRCVVYSNYSREDTDDVFAGPGKNYRKGITLVELAELFSTEEKAEEWFVQARYPDGVRCPRCDSDEVSRRKSRKPMPFHCKACRKYFSMKTGTVMHDSKLPLRTWGIAFYLMHTSLKGVSALRLRRDLGVTYSTAWHLAHRIRETWDKAGHKFEGPVEVDETYVGGKRKNMSNAKRRDLAGLGYGSGPSGKTAVVGMRDRATNYVSAEVVDRATKENLHEFVRERTRSDTVVYTDEAPVYRNLDRPHAAVNHSVSQYVDGQVSTNGVESMWSLLKRGIMGSFHHVSPKHLHRYIREFEGRHNQRPLNTIEQMEAMARGSVGKRLMYRDLVSGEPAYPSIEDMSDIWALIPASQGEPER